MAEESKKLSRREQLALRWRILSASLCPESKSGVLVFADDGVWVSLDPAQRTRDVRRSVPRAVVDGLASATAENLPVEILNARRDGWALQDLANALGMSRQWAYKLLQKAPARTGEVFPRPPRSTEWIPSERHRRMSDLVSLVGGPRVVLDLIDRYARLPEMVRYERSLDSEDARAVREFWNDLALLLSETGASVYTLSSAMGLSKSTLRNGLLRYGVSETAG